MSEVSQKTREYWVAKARGWAERLSGPQDDEFNAVMDDIMLSASRAEAAEARVAKLQSALALILDCVDYTNGACGLTEMIGGALPRQIIDRARDALKGSEE